MESNYAETGNRAKIRRIILLFLTILIVGTIGYMILLGINILDAIYMTVITITTVGFKEVTTMTDPAKIFSVFLIFSGVGTVSYTFSTLMLMLVDGKFNEIWRDRMNERKIADLKDHYIICSTDQIGEIIIDDFIEEKKDFVVITDDEDQYKSWLDKGVLVVHGNATDSEVLEKANIKSAKGLLSCMQKDVDNIVIVLTSRNLNKDLYIISLAAENESSIKLKQVGADKSISVNEIGGKRMSTLMLRPTIISFLDVVTRFGDVEVDLEEATITEESELREKTLSQAELPKKTGLIILAVKKVDEEEIKFNPGPDFVMNVGDKLIVMGHQDQIKKLKDML